MKLPAHAFEEGVAAMAAALLCIAAALTVSLNADAKT
jgi:hypothetical protein